MAWIVFANYHGIANNNNILTQKNSLPIKRAGSSSTFRLNGVCLPRTTIPRGEPFITVMLQTDSRALTTERPSSRIHSQNLLCKTPIKSIDFLFKILYLGPMATNSFTYSPIPTVSPANVRQKSLDSWG